jgi:hypothetical protein
MQVYFLDETLQRDRRIQVSGLPRNNHTNLFIMDTLETLMRRNIFLTSFTTAVERSRESERSGRRQCNLHVVVLGPDAASLTPDQNIRQYDAPVSNDIAVLIRNEGGGGQEPSNPRHMTVYLRPGVGRGVRQMSSLHMHYDSLLYVLFHFDGRQSGWSLNEYTYRVPPVLERRNMIRSIRQRPYVTAMEFYNYRLYIRDMSITERQVQLLIIIIKLILIDQICFTN